MKREKEEKEKEKEKEKLLEGLLCEVLATKRLKLLHTFWSKWKKPTLEILNERLTKLKQFQVNLILKLIS